jgi:hypothetical protein
VKTRNRFIETSESGSSARSLYASRTSRVFIWWDRAVRKGVIVLLSAMLTITAGVEHSPAEDVTLKWDRSPSKKAVGYKVYSGTVQGGYDHVVDVGNVTTRIVRGLSADRQYQFSITAYDAFGSESRHSNEVTWGTDSPDIDYSKISGSIAAVAYGSARAGEVLLLKRFRDHYLEQNIVGRFVIEVYGRVSPPLADLARRNEAFRVITRWGFSSVVYVLRHLRRSVAVFCVLVAGGAVGILCYKRWKKTKPLSAGSHG